MTPPATEKVIEVTNLSCGYGNTVVIENLSFSVNKGEIFGILGGSGCGKSTVLKVLIGLNQPISGEVLILETPIDKVSPVEKIKLLNRIGVMYQQGALFGSMTVLENLRLPLEEFTRLPLETMNRICLAKLELVGLVEYRDLMPSELSGGMRKRAAIARAMTLDPEILFLDEPSAGLDPITSHELDLLILRLAKTLHVSFVIVTHELSSVFTVADRVVLLEKSKKGKIAEGNPHELRNKSVDPLVKNFFQRGISQL